MTPAIASGQTVGFARSNIVAYNMTQDGTEHLQEGYLSRDNWQARYDELAAEIDSTIQELDGLRDYADQEVMKEVDAFFITDYSYISELEGVSEEFSTCLEEARAAEQEAARIAAEEAARRAAQSNVYSGSSASGYGSGSGGGYSGGNSGVLTQSGGVNYYNGNKETYYNLNMSGVIANAQAMGINGNYWVRDDGVKMYGDYVIVAAQADKGTVIDTSLGQGLVLDYCPAGTIDIATSWG